MRTVIDRVTWAGVAVLAAASILVGAHSGCSGADKSNDGTGSGSGRKPIEGPKKEIKDLILKYDSTDREEWHRARAEVVERGPQGHLALFNYLKYRLTIEMLGKDYDRLKTEWVWALKATKHPAGVHYLAASAADARNKKGELEIREEFRAAAYDILERSRGGVIEWPGKGEITIVDALLIYYANLVADPSEIPDDKRALAVEARINMLRMLAAAGASEEGLELPQLHDGLLRLREEAAWTWRARFFQALEKYSGDTSRQLLEAGLKDPDRSVRETAEDTLKRRNKLERQAKARASGS